MPPTARWPEAALAGFATSMRTFAAPTALAIRGRITGKARVATLLAAVGELTVDKLPAAQDRIEPPGLGGRIAAGAYSGHAIAGPAGLGAGAGGALVGAFATWRARKLVVAATGLPDPVVAVGEDVLAYTTAILATHRSETGLGNSVVLGLAAGLAGTAAMTIAQGAESALTGAKPSRAPATVADRFKRAAGLGKVKHQAVANQGMHWLYGTSWGIPLGIVANSKDLRPEVAGPVFGLLVWGAGLAHQPLVGVAEVPWRRSPTSLGSEAFFHLVYGIGTAAVLRALRAPEADL